MGLLIFYLFLALFFSFLCSIMESVLLSTSDSFLIVKVKNGHKSASSLIKLREKIERPLSAILSLNTIAHTIGAAGVGAQAIKIFGEAYFGIISIILTLLILVFSEIIPKTIGAKYWRELALFSGAIIRGMVFITYPLVVMTGYISKLISGNTDVLSASREEISAMASIGTKEGIIEEKENKIIQNIFRLKDIKVKEVLTPRVVVTTANAAMSLSEFLVQKDLLYYSRIPIYKDNLDNITGYVFRQEVFERIAEKEMDLKLQDICREIVIANEFQTIMSLWEVLLEKKEHIALIVDEYGGMAGIVTLEDIIESILGLEIVDERDKIVDMQQFARKRWNERKAKYAILGDFKRED